ncbi:MAG: Cob(I)alamin adenosyltransferase [Parcubacteria group bacterium GW2011_GWB1_50_9]|uniref:Cob(I)alamin adenosyltransferase n=1 Tax=Candidatus Adlerbacteria bacterium GW2011_GWC1_50_9 TaxID=1618608 RepID=A0A0G1WS71_9BACT|nr:MAG: Cob(I)alamin adenosyltransferase [Parcubacteria group bacterium GW2011_GWB1_50_9]KKW21698.1 MAG: Cob(I)alamin adenosyltransferase [Candidatus Adlerbacteria bacterium GW2011_GWC1_50_9]KKW33728.1 MAG: Cob(I)alamin adenosyltransferase [Parcubacteria group bacterium GW2011_GWA1_53_13]
MLYIFTGNGKGKTTSALGAAARAVGEGKRVLMVQFIKGPWKSGEDDIEIKGKGEFKLVKMGKGFVGILGDTLPRKEHEKAAEEALHYAKKETESGNWDILILDEVNNAVALNLISKKTVLELIDFIKGAEANDRTSGVEISSTKRSNIEHTILTGRDAPKEFIDRADLVTEMKDIKHPYEKGMKGKRGLEY